MYSTSCRVGKKAEYDEDGHKKRKRPIPINDGNIASGSKERPRPKRPSLTAIALREVKSQKLIVSI